MFDAVKRHIEQMAEMEQVLEELNSREIKDEDVLVNDNEIQDKYDELEKCRKMQTALHKDLLDGIISEEEYMQFGKIYVEREEAISQSITALRTEIIRQLTREMLLDLIEKIIVYEDSRLEIIFKYEDEYKTACKIAQKFIEDSKQEVHPIG